jgi:phosphatidylglycerol:prolipoprotein diacylglycerol transferase
MLPYFTQPMWTAGPFTVSAFGLLAAFAILSGWALTRRYASLLGLDAEAGSRLARLLVLGGFAGATAAGFSSTGGLIGASLTGVIFLKATGRPLRYFDAAALAFPPSWILFRAGCALAHDHIGAASSSLLAVRFPGGPRLDLGMIEMLATIPLAAAFAILARRGMPAGFPSGLLAAAYGGIRLLVAGLQGEATPSGGYALLAILTGAVVLGISLTRRRMACSGH